MRTIDEIIDRAIEAQRERNALLLDYYVTKLRRELELGIINIYTFPAFFLTDERASEFKSRISTAVLGREKAALLGLYDPSEGEEEDDRMELSEEELDLFFGDEDIDEGLPLMGFFTEGDAKIQRSEVVQ